MLSAIDYDPERDLSRIGTDGAPELVQRVRFDMETREVAVTYFDGTSIFFYVPNEALGRSKSHAVFAYYALALAVDLYGSRRHRMAGMCHYGSSRGNV